MKKIIALALAIMMVFSFVACTDSDSTRDKGRGKSSDRETVSVKECVAAVLNAENTEELKPYISSYTDEYAEQIMEAYPNDDYKVSVEKLGKFEEFEVYCCSITSASDPDYSNKFVSPFKKTDDGYLMECDADVLNRIASDCVCGTCNGTGSLTTGANTCGICAGTGVQYFPNAYFDAALQMWMGETRACSGCAGAGSFGGTSTVCPTCNGSCLVFD